MRGTGYLSYDCVAGGGGGTRQREGGDGGLRYWGIAAEGASEWEMGKKASARAHLHLPAM